MSELAVWSCPANFGDVLGPEILKRLGYSVRLMDRAQDADLVSCGSVIEMIAPTVREGCIVWGSGLMKPEPVDVSRLDIRAVRGRGTSDLLGVSVPLADPAILVPKLWDRPAVKYRLGVVRHYVDQESSYPFADAEIDTRQPVDDVIHFIGSCARIVSSSLHGLIVASAWGIPCVRAHHPDVLGGNFKWMDWMSGDSSPEELLAALP